MIRPPLELVIHPHSKKHLNTNWLTFYDTPDGLMTAGLFGDLPAAKRFTDAELAAEWHRHDHTFDLLTEGIGVETFGKDYIRGSAHEERALNQRNTLHRFATAPHYFEETP